MSTLRLKPTPRSSRWVRVLVVIAALILVGLGVLMVLSRAATARWHRYAARLRANGHALSFEEIEALRTRIPKDRDGAKLIESLAPELDALAADRLESNAVVLVFGRRAPDVVFFEGFPRYTVAPSRAFLEQQRGLLDRLARLRDRASRYRSGRRSDTDDIGFDIVLLTGSRRGKTSLPSHDHEPDRR